MPAHEWSETDVSSFRSGLAKAFGDGSAQTLLRSISFPPEDVPGFSTARRFWSQVVADLEEGTVSDGLWLLLTEARRQYPANPTFNAVYARIAAGARPRLLPPTGERRGPDLTLRVVRGPEAGFVSVQILSPYLETPVPEPAPLWLGAEAKEFAEKLISDVTTSSSTPDLGLRIEGKAIRIGQLVPDAFWDVLEGLAGLGVSRPTVLIESDEASIPWELARVRRPLDEAAPRFLNCQAAVGRRVIQPRGAIVPAPHQPVIRKMAAIGGDYVFPGGPRPARWPKPLPAASDERDALVKRYRALPYGVEWSGVVAALNGGFDAVHYSGHGVMQAAQSARGLQLLPDEGTASQIMEADRLRAFPLKEHAPFIFLNACQVGTGESEIGGYGGIADALLTAGASAVIAPLWSIPDGAAKNTVLEFYEKAFAGVPVAEVLRDLRCAVRPGDDVPVALAYQFFGDPSMVLRADL